MCWIYQRDFSQACFSCSGVVFFACLAHMWPDVPYVFFFFLYTESSGKFQQETIRKQILTGVGRAITIYHGLTCDRPDQQQLSTATSCEPISKSNCCRSQVDGRVKIYFLMRKGFSRVSCSSFNETYILPSSDIFDDIAAKPLQNHHCSFQTTFCLLNWSYLKNACSTLKLARNFAFPLLCDLNWLPVAACIRFKTMVLALKVNVKGTAPVYFQTPVRPHTPVRALCSITSVG